jgi:hypothetical protein
VNGNPNGSDGRAATFCGALAALACRFRRRAEANLARLAGDCSLGGEVRDGEGVIASTRGLPWRYL